jgi:hypothetical protein
MRSKDKTVIACSCFGWKPDLTVLLKQPGKFNAGSHVSAGARCHSLPGCCVYTIATFQHSTCVWPSLPDLVCETHSVRSDPEYSSSWKAELHDTATHNTGDV